MPTHPRVVCAHRLRVASALSEVTHWWSGWASDPTALRPDHAKRADRSRTRRGDGPAGPVRVPTGDSTRRPSGARGSPKLRAAFADPTRTSFSRSQSAPSGAAGTRGACSPAHRMPAPALLDAICVVVPRLPPEDRVVLRWRRLPERVRALQPKAVTDALRVGRGARSSRVRSAGPYSLPPLFGRCLALKDCAAAACRGGCRRTRRACGHTFAPMGDYGFTITEHDPDRPWMVLASEGREPGARFCRGCDRDTIEFGRWWSRDQGLRAPSMPDNRYRTDPLLDRSVPVPSDGQVGLHIRLSALYVRLALHLAVLAPSSWSSSPECS